jgi:hypothetical protein
MLEQRGVYTDEDFPHGKTLYSLGVGAVSDLPAKVQVPSHNFALLLAGDATNWPDEDIISVARKLLDKGLAVFVAWGPDCERVHDLFDSARNPEEDDDSVILTTWHGDETLDETLWFFVGVAAASESFADSCTSWVATSVNHPGWAEHMKIRMEGSKDLLRASKEEDPSTCCERFEASHDSEGEASPS